MAMLFSSNPSKMVFENDMDVVNYVSGGMLIPSRQDMNAIVCALSTPSDGSEMNVVKVGDNHTVTINIDGVPDTELLAKYMQQVYENRCKDRAMSIGFTIMAATGALLLGKMMGRRSAEKDLPTPDGDNRHYLHIGSELIEADIPGIE